MKANTLVERASAAIIHGAMTRVTWHDASRLRRYVSRNATSFVLQLRRCQSLANRCLAAAPAATSGHGRSRWKIRPAM
ncbi:hypothetical protein, partial [Xanthomonas citri]|uniref:hypothetical protein n=1 Tax=Xanthomonas citri TaxID=346 RepID=UPI001A9CFE8C